MDPDDLARIYEEDIAPGLFAGTTTSTQPWVILLGGQPGAGKSRAADIVLDAHPDHDIVPIVGDDFRRHHPDYATTLATNPTTMPDVTAAAIAEWTRRAVQDGLNRQASILIEGTWRNPQVPLDFLQQASHHGYHVHAAVVAVPPAISLVSTLSRYYDAPPDNARWTPVVAHDQAIHALPDTVTQIANSPLTHRFSVLDRTGTTHLDETLEDLPGRATRAHDTHAALFHRDLTRAEIDALVRDVQRLTEAHQARTWGTPAATQSWARVSQTLSQFEAADPHLGELRSHISHPHSPAKPPLEALHRNAFQDARTHRPASQPGQPQNQTPRHGPTP